MKKLLFLISLVLVASQAYAVTMGFKASTLYIIKGESVTFTVNFDPGEESADDSNIIIGEDESANQENTLPTSVTIKLKLDSQDGYSFSKTLEIDGADTITLEHTEEFNQAGYFDVEASFSWITVAGDGDQTVDNKKLDPIRIGVANWIFSAEGTLGCIESTPAVSRDGSTLFVGSEDSFLYALNTSDGSEKWRFAADGPINSTPALDLAGNLYFGSEDGFVYCLSQEGVLEWKSETNGSVFSSPALNQDLGKLYIGSTDNYLYAFNLDGSLDWRFQTGGKVTSSPVIGFDNTIYIGSLDHFLYALTPDGSEKWKFDAHSEISGSPALDRDGTIFFGTSAFGGGISEQNGLFAISPTGEEKWFVKHVAGFSSSPAIDPDGVVCIGANDNRMYGINRNGDELANFKKFSDDHMASPAMGSEDYIFCAAKDGIFYGLNRMKGDSLNGREEFWKYPLDLPVTSSSPVIKHGYVYVGTCGYDHGSIYSLFCDKDVEKTEVEVHPDSPWPQFRNDSQNSGRTVFTSATVAPEVFGKSPLPDETRMDLSRRSITVHFSRPMDTLSLYEPPTAQKEAYYGFTLEPFDSGPEKFQLIWHDDNTVCELRLPDEESFKPYITYTATLLSKARASDMAEDSENDSILYNHVWSFSFMDEESVSYDDGSSSPCFISTLMGRE